MTKNITILILSGLLVVSWTAAQPEKVDKDENDPAKSIKEFAKGLEDSNPAVRFDTAKELGKMGEALRETVDALRVGLEDYDPKVRAQAALSLAQLNLKHRAIDPDSDLTMALRDTNKQVRDNALEALYRIGYYADYAVPELVNALTRGGLLDRHKVLLVLGSIGIKSKPAVPYIVKILRDKKEPMRDRIRAATCLLYIGPTATGGVTELLQTIKRDEDLNLSHISLQALGAIGVADERVLPFLIKQLTIDKELYLSSGALKALYKMGPDAKAATPKLIEFYEKTTEVKDEKKQMRLRQEILMALGKIKDSAALPLLKSLLEKPTYQDEDKNEQLDGEIYSALVEFGPVAKPLLPTLHKFMKTKRGSNYNLGSPVGSICIDDISPLLKMLQDENKECRIRVLRSFAYLRIHAKSAIPHIKKLANDKSVNFAVRKAADYALSKMR